MSYEGRIEGATRVPSIRVPSIAEISIAREKLANCIAYLDAVGLDRIAAHASLAMERLREDHEPGYSAASELVTEG